MSNKKLKNKESKSEVILLKFSKNNKVYFIDLIIIAESKIIDFKANNRYFDNLLKFDFNLIAINRNQNSDERFKITCINQEKSFQDTMFDILKSFRSYYEDYAFNIILTDEAKEYFSEVNLSNVLERLSLEPKEILVLNF